VYNAGAFSKSKRKSEFKQPGARQDLSRMLKNLCECCHSEPFSVIPSEARNLALPVQGKLREESRSANPDLIGARFLVACGSSE
jgi:hypothetical protein